MESKAFDTTNHDPYWEGAARKGVAGLEIEAVHLRARVASLEQVVKAQRDELARLRGRDGLTFRERLILDAWPRFDDGVPVGLGDTVEGIGGEVRMIEVLSGSIDLVGANGHLHLVFGERVERPAPEVLDADGVPIKIGDTVYNPLGIKLTVKSFNDRYVVSEEYDNDGYFPSALTHREPDSWEKLEEDMEGGFCAYAGAEPSLDSLGSHICKTCRFFDDERGFDCEKLVALDVIRRAKKLAGVSE